MMHRVLTAALIALLGAVPLVGGRIAQAAPKRAEIDATKVVARSQRRLADALSIALAGLPEGDNYSVGIILDTTPTMKRWSPYIKRALLEVGEKVKPKAWVVAGLGRKFGEPVGSAEELVTQLPNVLSKERRQTNTLSELRTTIKTASRHSVVVYLADRNFEDEFELEKLIKDLDRKKVVLSVIGPEAAFSAAWNDGIKNILERGSTYDDPLRDYWENVTRSPYGKATEDAPKHCGDSACPLVPFRFTVYLWSAHFNEATRALANYASVKKGAAKKAGAGKTGIAGDRDGQMRRMLERLKRMPSTDVLREQIKALEELLGPAPETKAPKQDPDAPRGVPPSDDVSGRDAPIPSGFGPYPLMRAAGHTGGRYILFSWNRISGGTPYQLDYARCNLYPPDLRARKQQLRDLSKSKLARACYAAWDTLTTTYGEGLVSVTSPLVGKRLQPASMNEPDSLTYTRFSIFERHSERDQYVKKSKELLADLGDMRKRITRALPKDFPALSATERRRAAEAELFVHILDVAYLMIADEIATAESIEKSAFNGKEQPTLRKRTWIRVGRDHENIRLEGAMPRPNELAQALLKERARLLVRYAGTPIGEQIALNGVHVSKTHGFVPPKVRLDDLPPRGREQPSSQPQPPPPSGGPGSGGGGPTTGGG